MYKGRFIPHYRLVGMKLEKWKTENGGDPRLTGCANVDIDSGSTGMSHRKWESMTGLEQSNRKIIESLPVWVNYPSQPRGRTRMDCAHLSQK